MFFLFFLNKTFVVEIRANMPWSKINTGASVSVPVKLPALSRCQYLSEGYLAY